MPKFTVREISDIVSGTHFQEYEVDADSEAEAIEKVRNQEMDIEFVSAWSEVDRVNNERYST